LLQVVSINSALTAEREKTHMLERRLESAGRQPTPSGGKENRWRVATPSDSTKSDSRLQELSEEMRAMQANFAHTLQVKEQEIAMYKKIVENSRMAYEESWEMMHQQMRTSRDGGTSIR
jgi:hypothetical protein